MKKLAILTLLVAAWAACSLASTRAAGDTITITLNPQNGSGESGTATITELSETQVRVMVSLTGGGADLDAPQPAHIHDGTCANLNPKPKYPLTNVVKGQSETEVAVYLDDLLAEPYAINVHKSTTEGGIYVACGDIVAMTSPGMPTTGNSELLLLAGGLLLVALLLTGGGMALRRTRA